MYILLPKQDVRGERKELLDPRQSFVIHKLCQVLGDVVQGDLFICVNVLLCEYCASGI